MYLLDTNVVSELRRITPNAGVMLFMAKLRREQSHTAALVIHELLAGLEMNPGMRDAASLRSYVEWLIRDRFKDRIKTYDVEVARFHARLVGELKRSGRPKPRVDLQIAATALTHGFVLVTRNTSDFEGLGVPLLNPWTDAFT